MNCLKVALFVKIVMQKVKHKKKYSTVKNGIF